MKNTLAKLSLVALVLVVAVVVLGATSTASAANQNQFGIQSSFGHQTLPYPGPKCNPCPPCRYLYCVYYYDCHCGWKLKGCFHSRYQANAVQQSLQFQGFRSYIKVKRIGGGSGPVIGPWSQ